MSGDLASRLRSLAGCDARAGAPLGRCMEEAADRIAVLEAQLAEARQALQPFSNAIYNDNGDVTFDHSTYGTDDLWRAYCVLRRRRALPEPSPGGKDA